MAKTSSAKKALRVSTRRKVFNIRRKKVMKDAVKETGMPALYKAIDKAAKHGTIKKNTAARMKSRIAKHLGAATK
jgi:ribosomal protein S20